MSMRNYVCFDRGLILARQNLKDFIHKVCEEDKSLDPEYFEDELFEFAEYIGGRAIYGDDSDDIYLSMLDGEDNTGYDCRDTFLILPSTLPIYRFANLLEKDITADRLIENIKEQWGKYLPKDFDYLKYIGEIIYTVFG